MKDFCLLTNTCYVVFLTDKQAAWYPDDPNEKDRHHMTNFMAAFARFYPCPWCATDFQENLQKAPVKYVKREQHCTYPRFLLHTYYTEQLTLYAPSTSTEHPPAQNCVPGFASNTT
jgi:hypothetical protein